MNYNFFKNPTFWTIAAMVVFGGVNAVLPIIPAPWNTLVQVALGILATSFHIDAVKAAAAH